MHVSIHSVADVISGLWAVLSTVWSCVEGRPYALSLYCANDLIKVREEYWVFINPWAE